MEKNKQREKLIEEAARKLKVCGHPVRLRLLCAISAQGALRVRPLALPRTRSSPWSPSTSPCSSARASSRSRVKGNRRIYSVTDPWVRDLIDRLPTAAP